MNENKILEDENPGCSKYANLQNTQQLWEGQKLFFDDKENETQQGDKI